MHLSSKNRENGEEEEKRKSNYIHGDSSQKIKPQSPLLQLVSHRITMIQIHSRRARLCLFRVGMHNSEDRVQYW